MEYDIIWISLRRCKRLRRILESQFWQPVRYITKIPNEIMLTVENVDEEADYELLQQKVELEGRKPLRERYFG
ncbi:hypothetical protein RB195_020278 [Necator americanus]|uniref:Uncharacterized protein n=1 Tax=Necator americanus TaxID=51031 RepID=A0ABR1CI37_NECAM